MIYLKRLNENAILPAKKHDEDAGFDICSIETVALAPGQQRVYKTGWELVEIDQPILNWGMTLESKEFRCALFAWSKSGLDAKFGIHVGAGVIDHIFRGEILLLLKNQGENNVFIEAGNPLVQLIPMLYMNQDITEVKESGSSERGDDGGINRHFKSVTIESPIEIE